MHILLVNDDGIGSDGILALAREALSRGHRVSMVAPQRQQSAAGQHISLIDPIFVKEYDMGLPLAAAYGVAGTPTDCVRLALFALIQEPIDLVMSGINDGYNAGMAVYYSGTVGAAREAALGKRHSMAVSIHHRATATMLAHLARYAVRLGERYAALEVPPISVLNVNAPLLEPEALQPPLCAPLCTSAFEDQYIRRESPRAGTYFWLAEGAKFEPSQPGTDLWALEHGHISVTLMGNPADCTPQVPNMQSLARACAEGLA